MKVQNKRINSVHAQTFKYPLVSYVFVVLQQKVEVFRKFVFATYNFRPVRIFDTHFRWHLKIYPPPHPTHTHTHTLVTSFLFYITLNVWIHVLVPSEPVPIQTSSKSTASIPASNSNRKTSMKGRSNFSQCLPSLIDWFQTFLVWKVTDMKHTWR
jgi:hypothetical protein